MRLFNFKSNRVNDKNTNGKKKKSKVNKLIPPVAMISASMLLMAYSSYAWFAMNTQTTAEGMKVKVKGEGGIVISDYNHTTWSASATATTTSGVLYPTNTADAVTWYHNKSDEFDSSKSNQSKDSYTTLSINSPGTSGGLGSINDDYYYLLNHFYIKASGDTIGDNSSPVLKISSVSVDPTTLNDVDKSLRVAIMIGEKTYIYAPVNGADYTYNAGGSDNNQPVVCYKPDATDDAANSYKAGKDLMTTIKTITANDTAIPVDIYCYFEGEDSSCKSSNVSGITLNDITVSVSFSI